MTGLHYQQVPHRMGYSSSFHFESLSYNSPRTALGQVPVTYHPEPAPGLGDTLFSWPLLGPGVALAPGWQGDGGPWGN